MGLVVALRMPRVQTWAARHLTDLAREKTGFDVRIGYVSLNWFDRLVLHNVDVYDVNRHQMIHIDDAVLDFGWPRLLTRNVAFDEIWANNGHLDILRGVLFAQLNSCPTCIHAISKTQLLTNQVNSCA